MKVALFGTCGKSKWRQELIQSLKIDYFNPAVANWTIECQEEEIKQKELCDFCLYVITDDMEGFYSIAEAVEDSNKRPGKTIFCVLNKENFSETQRKSFKAIENLIAKNGAIVLYSLQEIADYVNRGLK